jgi:hypothetical protein
VKRSAALAPLSRDHHHALAAALRLRRADEESAAAAVAAFGEFWRSAGARHFEIEEELILPALSTGDDWARAVARVRSDHAAIRERAANLGDDARAARELGEILNDHVRFEERELFVLLEQRLPSDELARLGREVEEAEAR